MSYISFFVNQHIEELKIADKWETDSKSILKIVEELDKLKAGYYIIFETCKDCNHEVGLNPMRIYNNKHRS